MYNIRKILITYHGKDNVIQSRCWQSKEENGKQESSEEELIHVVSDRVQALAQDVPFLASEQAPEGRQGINLELVQSENNKPPLKNAEIHLIWC